MIVLQTFDSMFWKNFAGIFAANVYVKKLFSTISYDTIWTPDINNNHNVLSATRIPLRLKISQI